MSFVWIPMFDAFNTVMHSSPSRFKPSIAPGSANEARVRRYVPHDRKRRIYLGRQSGKNECAQPDIAALSALQDRS
jgi:hypothetical protein